MIRMQRPSGTWKSVVTAMAMACLLMSEVPAVDDETIAEQARRYDAACELVAKTERGRIAHPIEFSDDKSKSRHGKRAIVNIPLTHD